MRSICITLTSPFVLNAFLLGHLARLSRSFQVVVCINRLESTIPISLPVGVVLRHVEIRRAIAPWRDVAALLALVRFYRRSKFDAVFSVTPKGGLIAMLAAKMAYIPVRVHCFTGQVWATQSGLSRVLFKWIDRLLASCATELLVDSPSQRDFLVAEGIVAPDRVEVMGDGSISGVDLDRFRPDSAARSAIRAELGVQPEESCLIYVGRMKRAKGVHDLLSAFKQLRATRPRLHLLLVGPDEEGLLTGLHDGGIHRVDYTQRVEAYLAAADVICLPSYREGFGTVLIEAAAVGLPAVASRIYGITDAVQEGETGLLHPAGDVAGIVAEVERLLASAELRSELGMKARLRAERMFSAERVESFLEKWLLERIGRSGPSHVVVAD